MDPSRSHLPALTGIRGASALLIVIFHAYGDFHRMAGNPGLPGFRFGWVGVDLFFVLSGFILAWVLWTRPRDPDRRRFWGDYALQRTLRIIPTYYVALLATLVMLGLLSFTVERPGAFLLHLLLLQTFDPTSFASVNPLYWTLAVELHFYLLLPLILPLFSRRLWPYALAGSLALTLAWRWIFYTPETALFLFYMPAFLFHFCLGVVIARFVVEGWRPPAPTLMAVAAVLLFVVAPLALLIPDYTRHQALNSLAANLIVRPAVALGFALLIWAVCTPSLWQRTFSWRPLQASGVWSYSTYLIHVPLLLLLRDLPWLYQNGPWLYFLVGATVSVIGGYLLYRFVEDPMNRFRYRLRDPKRPTRLPRSPLPAPTTNSPSAAEGTTQ